MEETKDRDDMGRSSLPVVVGVDGSESSISALIRGVRMAKTLDVPLIAITAWSYPHGYVRYPASTWSPEELAQDVLAQATQKAFQGEAPEWFSFETRRGDAARVLVDASSGAQMLIVGSRGHGGFPGLLLGSVSSVCAEYAQCSVLVEHEN
jgi:nucleotide-binding universal stress UspA family protein